MEGHHPMEEKNDTELLQELSEGSHAAFSAIYKKYWKKIFVAAYDRLKDAKQSQDIVQDIFVRLWERQAGLDIQNLNAWLHASVRYSVFKIVGSEQARDEFFAVAARLSGETVAADHQLISAELLSAYQAIMEKMPSQRKKIFRMRYEENLKTRQIATALNISQKTVQNQLLHTYQEIRTLLTQLLLVLTGIFVCYYLFR